MGACISSDKKEIASLKALLLQKEALLLQKGHGEYWDTFDSVWDFELTEYNGSFSAALRLREDPPCSLYTANNVQVILTNGKELETIFTSNLETSSVFESDSVVSRVSQKPVLNRREDNNHERAHAKTILGQPTASGTKSRAHTIPDDKKCNLWWWPVFQLVTGFTSLVYDPQAISKLANMRTSKFVFSGEHANFYDTLKQGIVCPIPIFDSLNEMAAWKEKDGYKMLIIADSANTYINIGMLNNDLYPHISMATRTQVKTATTLLAEMMKVMADSLDYNWDGHYENLDETPNKQMLRQMKEFMKKTGKIHIPQFEREDGQDPKLYILDYDILYGENEEGKKYILDPYPALVKASVNLSYFLTDTLEYYKDIKTCKFLPGCGGSNSVSSEEEESSCFHVCGHQQTSLSELIGKSIELRHVIDDEYDDDDISQ